MDKHIDNQELSVLVPWPSGAEQDAHGLSPAMAREAARHVESCPDCARKVALYRRLLDRFSDGSVAGAALPGSECPRDVDWYEVAAGLWPELKARQLIMHAALCDHCGPLLRAASSLEREPTLEEEEFLGRLAAPSRPVQPTGQVDPSRSRWGFARWLIPAAMAVMLVAVVAFMSRTTVSGARFAEFAANTHKQHAHGDLALDFRPDSKQTLNEWLKANLPFSLALPADLPVPGEEQPYQVEGARMVQVRGKQAVYISYRVQKQPVGLIVTPDSVAAASGGVTVDYNKVSFHYRMLGDYKVVTWSLHERTYALVSQEGNNTQRSCMVCHSAMGDRDLSQTPTPLSTTRSAVRPRLQ